MMEAADDIYKDVQKERGAARQAKQEGDAIKNAGMDQAWEGRGRPEEKAEGTGAMVRRMPLRSSMACPIINTPSSDSLAALQRKPGSWC